MKRAAITDHVFPSVQLQRDVIEQAGFALDEIQAPCKTEQDVIGRCKEADVLLVQWAPITRAVLEALPNVQCVVRYGIGVDNIDVNAAKELKRLVANVPNYCFEEVSNHAIAMMLALARRIPQDHRQLLDGGWGIKPFLPIPALETMTLGLVGFGSIARRVAAKAKVFGLRVIASDPFVTNEAFVQNQVERKDFTELVCSADIISLHCPLVPTTRHLINRDTIEQMKPGALIINTSRGPLINEADLIEALINKRIAAAGLDVFETEPLPVESRLRKLSNVLLTSHAASVSESSRRNLQVLAAENARDFLQGKRPAGALF